VSITEIPPGGMADACQVCPDPPFDRPGCPAVAIQSVSGGTITAHECGHCGSTWRTWRDLCGWPIVLRLIDPVSRRRGGDPPRICSRLAEQGRERKHAA
jgi:hypothetical protein